MTKKQLKRYSVIVKRIEYLGKCLWNESSRDLTVVSGKVKGSAKEFPYTPTRFHASMNNPTEAKQRDERIRKYTTELIEQNKERKCIEEFVSTIADQEIKEIFQYHFLDGLTQQEVGEKVNLERSRISRRISDFLKNSTQSTN